MTSSQKNLSTGKIAAIQSIPFQHQVKPQHHILRITQEEETIQKCNKICMTFCKKHKTIQAQQAKIAK